MSNLCKDCKWWQPSGMRADMMYQPCKNPKIYPNAEYPYGNTQIIDGAAGGGFEGFGDYFHTAPHFGCVLFEPKKEQQAE